MIFNSIRWRLQAWHGLILVAVLTGFGSTAYHVVRDNQLRRVDQDLEHHLMSMFRPGPPPLEPGRPMGIHRSDPFDFRTRLCNAVEQAGAIDSSQTNGFYYVLWQQDGSALATSPGAPTDVPRPDELGEEHFSPESVRQPPGPPPEPDRGPESAIQPPAGAPGPGPGRAMLFRDGPGKRWLPRARSGMRELYRFMPGGECLLVGHLMGPEMAAMHRLAFWLFAAGTGVLAVGLAGGWWVATRAIRPIHDISATAAKIAAGDLSQRIDAADTESELGRLAGVLNSTFARLEAAFAHQARFTSDASHELRTPVSVILAKTQTVLARERAGSEYREALQACQRAAQRMRSLTESLLQLARLDAGQELMKREPFDLARVARDSVEMVRPLAAERQVEISGELPSITCVGDLERIGQVITNLLTNAINFNHPHGQVRLAAQCTNGTVGLSVSDTGEGIPAEDLPHIFERFYRVDKSRSRIQGRTGLGLAISKAIVDAHGGSIEVTSQPGEGSNFILRLPVN
jgi:signal transduction histidine kinase